MKIERVEKPKPAKKQLRLSSALVVDVVREGDEYRVEKSGVVVSRVSGVFREVCFFVDEYCVCFNRDELEDMFKG
jgi:hypothetical protein